MHENYNNINEVKSNKIKLHKEINKNNKNIYKLLTSLKAYDSI